MEAPLPPPPPSLELPAYQFPPEKVCIENAHRWKWMQAFYEREVSMPPSGEETTEQVAKRAARIKPTPEKLAYLDMELITFPHFGMSTISGHQQGSGKEDPASFNPVDFDAREWVRFHKAIGAKMIVFVAKHHCGYALWPSKLNAYNISSSPWRDGKGDMVKEISDACREGGLKLGLYISLRDLHDPRSNSHGKAPTELTYEERKTYQLYAEQQILETLIPYGEISELWFDGAGTRGIEDWNRIFELVHHYQPTCVVAMCGFGARWCGNESAVGDAINWNVLPMLPQLKQHHWVPFHYDQLISKNLPNITDDLNALKGQELFFIPQECDTRILQLGWHWDDVGEPLSLETLVNVYYASIGSGATLIISPSPDGTGVFAGPQVARLAEWRQWIDMSFSSNLLKGATMTLTGGPDGYDPALLLRDERDQSCVAVDAATNLTLVAEFPESRTFNNLVVEEDLREGQRVSAFTLESWQDGVWALVTEGRTVGHKRVLAFSDVSTDKVRLCITESRDRPVLKSVGVYQALPYREGVRTFTSADYLPAMPEMDNLVPGLRWSYYEDPANGFLPYQEMFGEKLPIEAPVATGRDVNPIAAADSVPKSRERTSHFAMRFNGYFRAPSRAVYTFRASAHTGCRVYVDGNEIIENDASGSMQKESKTADVPLLPGLHRFTVLFYYGAVKESKLRLSVNWPGNAGGEGFGFSPEHRLLELLCSEG